MSEQLLLTQTWFPPQITDKTIERIAYQNYARKYCDYIRYFLRSDSNNHYPASECQYRNNQKPIVGAYEAYTYGYEEYLHYSTDNENHAEGIDKIIGEKVGHEA